VSDALRYRLIDEPRKSVLQRFALPPLLVFLVATYFLPWGLLLIAANAVALNGPFRNREIGFAIIPIVIFFAAIMVLDAFVRADLLEVNQAHYFFVAAVGVGLVFVATAYVSQHQTAELRRYIQQQG
jgi:hypothetical protein